VSDGHGVQGHLVAFRVAQALPKYVFDNLDSRTEPENVIAQAFELVRQDLARLDGYGLDLSGSGATCSVVLRQGDRVHVAWLGDSRVLIATVVDDETKVDLYTEAHTPENAQEKRRVLSKGGALRRSPPSGSERLFTPNGSLPGLSVTRSFGNRTYELGVLTQPEVMKTSFGDVPGVVLLASGGLCEFFEDGEAVVDILVRRGELTSRGAPHALSCLKHIAQERWRDEANGAWDDVTGLVLYWTGAAPPLPQAQPTGPPRHLCSQPPGYVPPSEAMYRPTLVPSQAVGNRFPAQVFQQSAARTAQTFTVGNRATERSLSPPTTSKQGTPLLPMVEE